MEEDDSDTYTVVLTMQPTADVTVTVTVPSDADVTVNRSPLTFTDQNWDTPQTVTVSSTADTDTDDDEVTLTHTVSGGYTGVTADDVTVNVTETTVTANSPPSIFHNSRTVDENFTGTISIVGTDPDDRDYITGYELTGGRDRALFEITTRGGRGELSFVDVPDFENPAITSNRYPDADIDFSHGSTEIKVAMKLFDYGAGVTITGSSLRENGLEIFDEIMVSPIVVIARSRISKLIALGDLMAGALEAENQQLIKLNVDNSQRNAVLDALPARRAPTLSALSDCASAIETVVPKSQTAGLLIRLRTLGATDIIVQNINAIVG